MTTEQTLREALERVMIGGNHLANVLIGRLGGGFANDYPPDLDHDTALDQLGAGDTYEVWCCWACIMRVRAALTASAPAQSAAVSVAEGWQLASKALQHAKIDYQSMIGYVRNLEGTPYGLLQTQQLIDEAIAALSAAPPPPVKELFQTGDYRLHSGARSSWKIDCDALTDKDIETLALMIGEQCRFSRVIGIPRGGLRIAAALQKWADMVPGGRTLIVDDVLTTGASMEAARAEQGSDAIGFVLFARGPLPSWVRALFSMVPPPPVKTVTEDVREALEQIVAIRIADSSGLEVEEDSLHEIRKVARTALALPREAGVVEVAMTSIADIADHVRSVATDIADFAAGERNNAGMYLRVSEFATDLITRKLLMPPWQTMENGWRWVPEEATDEMEKAGWNAQPMGPVCDWDMRTIYRAFLSAAPSPPPQRETVKHTDRDTPCPTCGFVIRRVERKPFVIEDDTTSEPAGSSGRSSEGAHTSTFQPGIEESGLCHSPTASTRAERGGKAMSEVRGAEMSLHPRQTQGCCIDCGRKYGDQFGFPDLVVPNDVWAKISPTGHEGGLLCPSCMCRRAYDAGLENVPAVFRSGPFVLEER